MASKGNKTTTAINKNPRDLALRLSLPMFLNLKNDLISGVNKLALLVIVNSAGMILGLSTFGLLAVAFSSASFASTLAGF